MLMIRKLLLFIALCACLSVELFAATTGGDATNDYYWTPRGYYHIHTFLTNGTFTLTNDMQVDVMGIAGGGGGGLGNDRGGGGGGAGGYGTASFILTAGVYQITVPLGGGSGTNGSNLVVFGTTIANGGGHGGGSSTYTPSSGGSGGGSSGSSDGANGIVGQGFRGGNGDNASFAAGGGGAGAAGVNSANNFNSPGGAGRVLLFPLINLFGGGGGAGGNTYFVVQRGIGGLGGGGAGGYNTAGTNGSPNTGGGGGGGSSSAGTKPGGTGGSGILYIRHLTQSFQNFSFIQGGGATTSAVLSTTSRDPGWTNDPYSNAWAFAFFGGTNTLGNLLDSSPYARHISANISIYSTILSTNSAGRVERGIYCDDNDTTTLATTNSNSTNFLNGVTSITWYVWLKSKVGMTAGLNNGVCMYRGPASTYYAMGYTATSNTATFYREPGTEPGRITVNTGTPFVWTFVASSWTATSGTNMWCQAFNVSPLPSYYSVATNTFTQTAAIYFGRDTYNNEKWYGWVDSMVCYTNVIIPLSHATNFFRATNPTNSTINY